jgi:phage repressor protein C with HTH and peptisase S24 domain
MSLGERIRLLRGGRQQAEIAQALGIHRNTYARYEMGDSVPDVDTALHLLELFPGTNPLWFFTGKGEQLITALQKEDLVADRSAFVSLPPFAVHGPLTQNYLFRKNWLQEVFSPDLEELVVYLMPYDSMSPTISKGDVAIIDKSKTLPESGVFLLKYNDAHFIRRLHIAPDHCLIQCDNQDKAKYRDDELSTDDFRAKCVIIGRVVWVGKHL